MILKITPKDGKEIRKPDYQILDSKGEELEVNPFWLRRERDGDVTIEKKVSEKEKNHNPKAKEKA